MSGATPLLPHLPSWGAHGEPCHYMILHLRAPVENKTRTERVDELQRRGSERELLVYETGMGKSLELVGSWWGRSVVIVAQRLCYLCVSRQVVFNDPVPHPLRVLCIRER